jgi:hypothetical protein
VSTSTPNTPPGGARPPEPRPLSWSERRRLRAIEASLVDADPALAHLFAEDPRVGRRRLIRRICWWSVACGFLLIVVGSSLSAAVLVMPGLLATFVVPPIAWWLAEMQPDDP